jgi:hypothetical protein
MPGPVPVMFKLEFLLSQLKVRSYHVTLLINTLVIVQLSLHSTTSMFVTVRHPSACSAKFFYCFFSFSLLIYTGRTTMTRNCHLLANATRGSVHAATSSPMYVQQTAVGHPLSQTCHLLHANTTRGLVHAATLPRIYDKWPLATPFANMPPLACKRDKGV